MGGLRTGLVAACLLGSANDASACTCLAGEGQIAWPTLEQAAGMSDAVLIGRVLARQTLNDPPPYDGSDVASVDVLVLDGIKGVAPGAHVRVWDAGFSSSCTVDLRRLHVGTIVAMAVMQNSPDYTQYLAEMRLSIAPEDYLLESCGDYMLPLKSEREIPALAKRLKKGARESPTPRKAAG